MMETTEKIREIKATLRCFMNGAVSQSMRQKGLVYKVNFGVELPRLKEIAVKYGKEHSLAQELWKEDIRECKILATMIQPAETFYPEIMDIWIDSINNMEIAELVCMNLFQHVDYAPSKSFQLISEDREYAQICGFLTIARLLRKKNDMEERVENEFLDQAVVAFLSGSYHVVNSVTTALKCYIHGDESHAFAVCRAVDRLKEDKSEKAATLREWIAREIVDA